MSRIRSRDTLPERVVRSVLHRLGCRFRLKPQKLPGSPDVVLTRHRTVVLVHGCFWHRHSGCRYAYTPKSRRGFWEAKFAANIRRDRQVRARLRAQGWKVIEVWECQTKDIRRLESRLRRRLGMTAAAAAA